jgi:hypothetical protein
MADPNSNKNPGQLRKDLQELERLKSELGKDFDLKAFKDVEKNASNIKQLLRDWRTEFNEVNRSIKDIGSELKEAWKDISQTERATKNIDKAFKSIISLSDDLRADQNDITQLSERELKNMQEKLKKNVQSLIEARNELAIKHVTEGLQGKELDYYNELTSALADEDNYFKKISASLSARLIKEKQITQQLGISGNAVKALGAAMDKFGIGSFLKMDEINAKMRKAAEENKSRWQVLGVGLKASFASLGAALTDPLTILKGLYDITKKLISLATAYQSKQFEVAKALGVSVTQGTQLLNNFQHIATSQGKAFVTAKQLAEEYTRMTDQMGILAPATEEFALTSTQLQRRIGASAESMEMLQVFAAKTGSTLSGTYAKVVGIGKAESARLKISMSEKQVLEAVSKTSATIFNNFNGNLAALTKSVIQAKKMGTTLDTIAKAGDSMLDFESSISKEFEAQLLTGKDLNLSKARELALNHDTDGLMKELNSKMMSFSEYNKMNVLQQQSFAEALGLSKDQMDEIYRNQQKQNVLGELASASQEDQYQALVKKGMKFEDISKIMGEQAAEDAKRASVQEEQAALQEKMADEIGRMTQGLTDIVNKVMEFLSNMDNVKAVVKVVAGIIGAIVGYSIRLKMLDQQRAQTQIQLLETQIAQNVQLQKAAANQGMLDAEEIVGAEAEVMAGSWYLGPGALAVGAAVASMLGASLLTSGMGGGGEGGGSSLNSSNIPGGINPVNSNIPNGAGTTNTGGNGKAAVNLQVVNKMDPINGKHQTIIYDRDHGGKIDNQSGVIGNQ